MTRPVAINSHAVAATDYPLLSIRLQEQGTAVVKYLVKEDGSVGDCDVTKSSGKPVLDDAACAMVTGRWKFKPATKDGKPVAEFLTAEVAFKLSEVPNGPAPTSTALLSRPPTPPAPLPAVKVPRDPRLPTPPEPITSHVVTVDDYPVASRGLQEQGTVEVKYLVREDGVVSDCTVTASSGKRLLDIAACTIVKRRWKFKPAMKDGKPFADTVTAGVIFRLK
jgi:TonB family protein